MIEKYFRGIVARFSHDLKEYEITLLTSFGVNEVLLLCKKYDYVSMEKYEINRNWNSYFMAIIIPKMVITISSCFHQ